MLTMLPCLDSAEQAEALRRQLNIPGYFAAELGRSAVEAIADGYYDYGPGQRVDWSREVASARQGTVSIRPDDPLPERALSAFLETRVRVMNATTLAAARPLAEAGLTPLALNFANGVQAGGGFLEGALAQEENLCRSSALYHTIKGDAMYAAHRRRTLPDSTDWVIYSPDVPVFRTDGGTELERPWPLSFVTCAAPYAPAIGQPEAGDLLRQRIHRVLEVAKAYGHTALVLGAWGCGAFQNDPDRTARDFHEALETTFAGAFSDVIFAIADWSPERKYLEPFRDVFSDNPA